jgi:hypothetical protein
MNRLNPIAALTATVLAMGALAKDAPSELLGVKVGQPKEQARTALDAIGDFTRAERKRQELWSVDDARFESAILGFDEAGALRFVTAVARPAGKQRMRFKDVGDLRHAKVEGSGTLRRYTWTVPARGATPAHLVIAIGSDPRFLTYLSLKRVD